MVTNSEVRQPMTRPLFPRMSSSESGVFFCGMRLDPLGTLPVTSRVDTGDPVLGEPAQMDHGDGGSVQEVEGEIAIAGDIHAVARDAVEAEIPGHGLAVEGKAAAGECAGTERENVGAAARLFEALPIAQEHLEVRSEEHTSELQSLRHL